MRAINVDVSLTESITVTRVATIEDIDSYNVDIANKFTNASIKLYSQEGETLRTENYYLDGDNHKNFPSETDIWIAVDRVRKSE